MKVRRVRCPECKSLQTVKKGKRKLLDYGLYRKSQEVIQRYKCKGCGISFTLRNQPHQKCLKHAMDAIDRLLELRQKRKRLQKIPIPGKKGYRQALVKYIEAEGIHKICRQVLYSKESVKYLYRELNRVGKKYLGLKRFFDRHLDKLLTYKRVPKIKKTNNIAENINRQLMRRLKTIESFKGFTSAENYLNLYKNYLRFKPYTDCRGDNKVKNGRSPIEIYAVKLKTKDWLKNAVCFY